MSGKSRFHGQLCEIFQDLSGVDVAAASSSSTFLDLGFDSLFLTQVTQALQTKFHVKVTFRQLMSDLSSLDALAQYLDEKLPADRVEKTEQPFTSVPQAPPAVVPPKLVPAPTKVVAKSLVKGSSVIEQAMRDQLQAMNALFAQQLAALTGGSTVSVSRTEVSPADRVVPVPTKEKPAVATPLPPKDSDVKELKGYAPFKPLATKISGELTPTQEKYIRELQERYSHRTPRSKEMTQRYRRVLADPRVVAGFKSQWKEMVYPIITNRSKGSHLWDIDGNEYVDILNGFGPIMLGHRPDFVEEAVAQQLQQGFEIGPQTLLAGEVAELICEMTGNERATFCNTGSEAVVAAIRVARTVTGRNKIVIFSGDYHGMFDEVLVKGIKKNGEASSLPSAPGIPREKAANITVLEYGTDESLEWIRKNANELAAVIVEPVQSRHPNLQPVVFLKEIRKITEASETCFVFDEVVTGFRVHPGGCQALFGIRADLATYGKVLAGGMPIGVLAGKAKYMDALDGGMWQFGDGSFPEVGVTFMAGTFVRHPLAMAASKSVLLYLKEQGSALQNGLNERSAALARRLNELFEKNQVPTKIENFASIFHFSFPPDFRFGSLFYYSLRLKGIHVLEGFPCFLTTEHSAADIERIVIAFEETISEMKAAGMFPVEVGGTVSPASAPELAPGEPDEVPLTESQREIWLAAQLSDEASCAFNESLTLHLRGSLNVDAFIRALQTLVVRHEALRGSISADGLRMKISSGMELQVAMLDLSELDAAGREERLKDRIAQEARLPFDMANGPLVRAALFRLEADRYAFVFTGHHIICDGWSVNVLLDELGKIYGGKVAELPPPVKFSAYAKTQASEANSASMAEVENYWVNQYRQPAPVLELPTDNPRAAVKSFAGATYRTRIDRDTYQLIKAAGTQQGCTLFVTLLAGFYALLYRLTQQGDLVVGIPTAGQSLLEEGSLVGHCVNFLPLRCQFANGETSGDLLLNTKRVLLDAYEHQSYTFGTLVRKLRIPKDPSRLPLVEVQFNLERVGTALEFPGLQADVDPNPKAAVNFDIFLNIVESSEGLLIDCDYNTELFSNNTIGQWLDHYETILRGFAQDAQQTIDRLPVLTAAQTRRLLVDWNATDMPHPKTSSVQDLIAAQTEKSPNSVAVSDERRELTYLELDRRSNQLASHLRKLGIREGGLVGICTDRSVDMLVALLAIWKAGAAYVPLDPTYPAERLNFILEETRVPILVIHSTLRSNVSGANAKIVCLDSDWQQIEKEPSTPCGAQSDPHRNAYVIFTSGSTGKPKGVEVTHRNVVNLLVSMRRVPGLASEDRLLAVTTLSFDIAGLELFLPLIAGAQVILANRETCSDGRLLVKRITEKGVTVMQATPATWRLMLEAGWKGSPSLKVLCGGEAFPRDLANQLVPLVSSVWNMYGPTETTIWSATSPVETGEGPVLIGGPIGNTQFYVLDASQQPVPTGVPGELYIGGDGVAAGYYKRPDLTAERFIPDPFRANSGARLFRTGDLARYRHTGELEFLGRLDNQVKIRGFRIELGEIEMALAKHPAVREGVVAAREDSSGMKRLIGYVVSGETRPTTAELRAWVGHTLPEYMIPSLFVFLSALPRTPNGKIDRKALPEPDSSNLGRQSALVAPRTPREEQLIAICKDVLRLDRVSAVDSLFDLGADSIHLFQIIARAAKLGMTIKPQQLLTLRTIAALGAELDAVAGQSVSAEPSTEIKPVSRDKYRVRLTSKV